MPENINACYNFSAYCNSLVCVVSFHHCVLASGTAEITLSKDQRVCLAVYIPCLKWVILSVNSI